MLEFRIFCIHVTAYARGTLAENEKPTLQNMKTEHDLREMVVRTSSP